MEKPTSFTCALWPVAALVSLANAISNEPGAPRTIGTTLRATFSSAARTRTTAVRFTLKVKSMAIVAKSCDVWAILRPSISAGAANLRSIVLPSPPERKATRELLKPGGLSGELPAVGDADSVHPLERNHHPTPTQKGYN